jgi:small subunit ribosomal protein S16
MVRIRLRRTGLKNQPTYRIMVADKEAPRDGRFLEILGSYNPRTEPFTLEVNEERVYHWMSTGAQPSESVAKLFKIVGLTDRYVRYKAGEKLETLMEESRQAFEARKVDNRTRRD